MWAKGAAAAAAVVAFTAVAPSASGEQCRRAVVFTLPATTWKDVVRWDVRAVLDAARAGAVGSLSVRTITSRTSLASGFATLGAGARVDGGRTTGGPAFGSPPDDEPGFVRDVRVAGLGEMRAALERSGYSGVRPGALASALPGELVAVGNADGAVPAPAPVGYGRWTLLAAMDERAIVARAATGAWLTTAAAGPLPVETDERAIGRAVDEALRSPCAAAIVDHGDLARLELAPRVPGDVRARALQRAGDLLAHVRARLDPRRDLLLVVSPTTGAHRDATHFGVAVAVGPGFPAGTSLESATTQRPGIVTLTDVAPTLLAHAGASRPPSMIGRAWTATAAVAGDRVAAAVALDDEATFVDAARTPVSSAYVLIQIFVFTAVMVLLWRRARRGPGFGDDSLGRYLELGALALAAFPVTTYLIGAVDQHALGPLGFTAALIAVDALLVALTVAVVTPPLDRLLALSAFTTVVLLADTVTGARLQLNTVFSYSPIVAGRFSGVGNIAFSVLAATTLVTATLVVHRAAGSRRALAAAAVMFAVTTFVDGSPQFGSDVGGVLALVPGFAIAWILLAGRRPSAVAVALTAAGAVAALALFLALDLARPEHDRTHLARLYEDVRAGGADVLVDAIDRKVTTNLRVFRSTIWTYLVPPTLAFMAWLLVRPRGRWRTMAVTHPRLRAGLVAGVVLSVIGFAVNDSGIVIPAVILSVLAPMAVVVHLTIERDTSAGAA